MATFYYNRFSSESISSQWTKHLQSQQYIKSIDSIVSKNKDELQSAIENGSEEQRKAIQNVCGSLDDGFALISSHFNDVKYELSSIRAEIHEMAAMLDWKLTQLIEEQRITNQLLGHISQLLRIPDSQKERVYHIEQGLKYYKNALMEDIGSAFFDDAIESFREAEKIEKKDFITLNRIGQIFLYSQKYLNYELAEEYFLKSAREAMAESNVGGTTTSNSMSPFKSTSGTPDFKLAAAEAYLYAGRACYLQNKLTQAAKNANSAFQLIPDFCKAGFEYAKYLSADDKVQEALLVLSTIIEKDRYFAKEIPMDEDFYSKELVLKFLHDLTNETVSKAKMEYDKCNGIKVEYSAANDIMDKIQLFISKCSYLSAKESLDLLNCEYKLPYSEYSKGYYCILEKKLISTPMKLYDFIELEKTNSTILNALHVEVRKEIIKKKGLWGGILGLVPGFILAASVHPIFRGLNLNATEENILGTFLFFFPIVTFNYFGRYIAKQEAIQIISLVR